MANKKTFEIESAKITGDLVASDIIFCDSLKRIFSDNELDYIDKLQGGLKLEFPGKTVVINPPHINRFIKR